MAASPRVTERSTLAPSFVTAPNTPPVTDPLQRSPVTQPLLVAYRTARAHQRLYVGGCGDAGHRVGGRDCALERNGCLMGQVHKAVGEVTGWATRA